MDRHWAKISSGEVDFYIDTPSYVTKDLVWFKANSGVDRDVWRILYASSPMAVSIVIWSRIWIQSMSLQEFLDGLDG